MTLLDKLVDSTEKLIESVEFDVNGAMGHGGHGGLTSDDTLRMAGEVRFLLSQIKKLRSED